MIAMPTDDDDDESDWFNAVADVRPLKPHGRAGREPTKNPVRRMVLRPRDVTAPHAPIGERTRAGRQIDKGTEKRIKRGQIEIEGRLDLHGYTVAQAHDRLKHFVIRAQGAGKRCVVVVTGKGELPNPDGTPARRGAIRREFQDWLHLPPLNHLILKAVPARPEDGGAGAFYLYLRRNRDD